MAAGERLLRVCPADAYAWVHRSYALHELRRTREAFDLLLPALRRFPQEIIIPYNLACYTCQLGDRAAARRWFQQALALDHDAEEKLHRLRAAPKSRGKGAEEKAPVYRLSAVRYVQRMNSCLAESDLWDLGNEMLESFERRVAAIPRDLSVRRSTRKPAS